MTSTSSPGPAFNDTMTCIHSLQLPQASYKIINDKDSKLLMLYCNELYLHISCQTFSLGTAGKGKEHLTTIWSTGTANAARRVQTSVNLDRFLKDMIRYNESPFLRYIIDHSLTIIDILIVSLYEMIVTLKCCSCLT